MPQDSVKDDMQAVAASLAGQEENDGDNNQPEPVEGGEVAEASSGEAAPVSDGESDVSADDANETSRPRRPDGKFAKKSVVEKSAAAPVETSPETGQQPPEKPPAVPPAPAFKAPQSWKPEAREALAKAPALVQQEVTRREREMQASMQKHAESAKALESVQKVVSPFTSFIRANGGEVLPTIQNLLQTQHALQNGPPHQKAQLVASMIKGFGIDINQLADALAGQQGAPAAQYQAAPTGAPDIDAILEQKLSKMAAQAEERRALADVDSFVASEPEFFDTVRPLMASLLDGGAAGDIKEAYELALKTHPETAPVVAQREAAKRAATPNGATARAKLASIGVKSKPSAMPRVDDEDDSVAATMRSVARDLQSRTR